MQTLKLTDMIGWDAIQHAITPRPKRNPVAAPGILKAGPVSARPSQKNIETGLDLTS